MNCYMHVECLMAGRFIISLSSPRAGLHAHVNPAAAAAAAREAKELQLRVFSVIHRVHPTPPAGAAPAGGGTAAAAVAAAGVAASAAPVLDAGWFCLPCC